MRTVLRVFFREVVVEGRGRVPTDRGGLFVAWHPNGLIDPALILAVSPGEVVFGARDGLLRWPILGPLMRIAAVPIYRAQDQEAMTDDERRAANAASLGALADRIAGGSFAALFPEGVSHDAPHLADVRSGAARLYLTARAATPPGRPPPAIVPVGLHYADKDGFRTDVLVEFHPPLDVPEVDPADDPKTTAARLTEAIETALERAVHPTADWALHRLMHRARTLIAAEAAARRGERPQPETVAGRVAGFQRIWAGYEARQSSHADEIAGLRADLWAYDDRLRALGFADDHLDRPPLLGSPVLLVGAAVQAAVVAVLLPPLLVLGAVVNVPPYWLLKGVAIVAAKAEKDVATVKIMGGAVLFPAFWAAAGWLAARGWIALPLDLPEAPWAVGAVVAVLSALGGVAVLLYSEVARGAWRALRVRAARWRHADHLPDLRARRADLHDRFLALDPTRDPARLGAEVEGVGVGDADGASAPVG